MGVKGIIKSKVRDLRFFKEYFDIVETKIPLSFKQYIKYKLKKKRSNIYWPVHKNSIVSGNVKIGINSSVGATPGCYIQGIGEVIIGDYTILAPNVGIISSNHDFYDYRVHHKNKVVIGNYCWVGMNAVVLPGVVLGNHTIVAAGAIVTKSFEEGYCVIGGNPAKIIKRLDRELTIDYKDEYEYYGYIPKSKFEEIH